MDYLEVQIRFRTNKHGDKSEWIEHRPMSALDESDMLEEICTLRQEAMEELEGENESDDDE